MSPVVVSAVLLIVSAGTSTSTLLVHRGLPLAGGQLLPTVGEETVSTSDLSPGSGSPTVTE